MVKPIESSWPRLKRGPVPKVTTPIKTPLTSAMAATMPLEVIVREVEESLARVGEATDGEVQRGTRFYPLRATYPLCTC